MPADREVTPHTVLAKVVGEIPEFANVELKDQREADEHGIALADRREDDRAILLEVEDRHRVPVLAKDRREVPEAEICLDLESNEDDVASGVSLLTGRRRLRDLKRERSCHDGLRVFSRFCCGSR